MGGSLWRFSKKIKPEMPLVNHIRDVDSLLASKGCLKYKIPVRNKGHWLELAIEPINPGKLIFGMARVPLKFFNECY